MLRAWGIVLPGSRETVIRICNQRTSIEHLYANDVVCNAFRDMVIVEMKRKIPRFPDGGGLTDKTNLLSNTVSLENK